MGMRRCFYLHARVWSTKIRYRTGKPKVNRLYDKNLGLIRLYCFLTRQN